jgi:DNA polymerase I-like protein with 3'-5' exonuclease and polymerase domains
MERFVTSNSKYVWVCADYSQAEARVVAWRGPVTSLKTWFLAGEDIHLNVAKMIGRIVQEHKIKMPRDLWRRKPWQELSKADEERQVSKNTVHGNNYGLGVNKFAYMTGLPVRFAATLQTIYHSLLPDIRGGYHKWIENEINTSGGFTTPMGRRRDFYDIRGPDLYRAAYAGYAQSTVGDLLVNTLCDICEVFHAPARLGPWTPERIRSQGLDVRLQLHDNVNVVVPNDAESIAFAVQTIKTAGEKPLVINGDSFVIPMDFKVGPNLSDLKEYKIC